MALQYGGASSGTCSACGLLFRLVPSTGVLYRHGHSASFPPCIGSGRRPVGALPNDIMLNNPDVLDEGMCQSPGSPSVEDSSESLPAFDWSSQHTRLVKRIPKADRAKAGRVFESCLKGVVGVGTLASWKRLLSFPSSLRQPIRGGRRINLPARLMEIGRAHV